MSKQSGLNDGLVVDGVDLSGDTNSLNAIAPSRPTHNTTGIDKSGIERIHLRRDGRIDWSSHFNPTNDPDPEESAHEELSTLPATNRIVSYLRGQSLGNAVASMVAKQLNYDPTRNADGALSIGLQARANGFGLEWGVQLTDGFETFTSTGAGSNVDPGSGTTAFGLQAYLHVLALDGTDVDVEIQDDGGTIGSGVSFPTMDGIGSARIQTDRDESITAPFNINVTGTFTAVTLMVAVVPNLHLVRFGAA